MVDDDRDTFAAYNAAASSLVIRESDGSFEPADDELDDEPV